MTDQYTNLLQTENKQEYNIPNKKLDSAGYYDLGSMIVLPKKFLELCLFL